MLNNKKGFMRLISITMTCALLFAGGCANSADNTPSETNETKNQVQTSEAGKAVEPTENEPTSQENSQESTGGGPMNERIEFLTQEYNGDNIAEIPYIWYDAIEPDPEIELVNRSLDQAYQFVYDDFMANKLEQEWIEIRSYPFTTDNYLQIVITNCVYPTYGTDGEIYSINYDKNTKKWLMFDDAFSKAGLDESDILYGVGQNFIPEAPGELIDDVHISGFLIHDTPNGEMIEWLLQITVQNPNAESWLGFYSYFPDGNDNTNDLTRLSNQCLFDPYNMDQMEPPLSYQKNLDVAQNNDTQNNDVQNGDPQSSDSQSDEENGRTETDTQEENRKNLWITVADITENGVLMDSQENDEGVRADTYIYDDIVRIAIERLPPAEYGAASVIALTSEWENIPESELDADEQTVGSYPAFMLAYEKNGNWHMDLYVQTDSWDFRIHTEMPVDIPGMDEDEEYNYVEQTAILWFREAEIVSE